MQIPSTKYNAWNKVKGGDLALKTWSDPSDIIVMISADVEAKLDVEVLAAAFNMSKADFLGRVIVVDDFSQYNEDGSVAVDGSGIQAAILDRAWFKIKTQDFAMDEFYNANNRTWQYYLNDVRMVNYSLFANAVVFATEASNPTVAATDIDAAQSSVTGVAGSTVIVPVALTPANATSTISVSSSASTYATAAMSGRNLVITCKAEGSATITITANGHSDTVSVTVTAAPSE